ncbi:hypothetical protein O181_084047 [Austropuccinia psidii MF-1]|uniref:Uncharacterized protein n=1 Tax=Austropuccinia psidii MF-1 TaxID=1389203 RepID=A0A9Q3IKM4_9BASI|nr:hypothetical protein [Austropuccinia psidii MF-1]
MIIDTEASCSIVGNKYLKDHFPKWEEELIPNKSRKFKCSSGRINSLGTIFKEIILPHRNGNTILKPEFVILENAQVQGFLLGTEYQRIYNIDIFNSKNRHLTIGENKDKKFHFEINNMTNENILKYLLENLKESQYGTQLTSKMKLNLLKILRKDKETFEIGDEPLGKIKQHEIELIHLCSEDHPTQLGWRLGKKLRSTSMSS